MSGNENTFALFRLLQVAGIGPVKLGAVVAHTNDLGLTVAEAIENPKIVATFLNEEQTLELRGNEASSRETWNELEKFEVIPLSNSDAEYPSSLRSYLGTHAPPLIFVKGETALLKKPSLGFCGSRKASDKGLLVAQECADIVSKEGINIVSGYAAGVDMATHRAALESGGTTSIILAEGILHFRIKGELKELWDWKRVLVVSQYLPRLTWSVHNAMARNQTICALCRAMVLIEARDRGGSMEAGRTCLKLGIPLFAPVYEGMPEFSRGNSMLLNEGAKSLYKSKYTNLPNLRGIISAFHDPDIALTRHSS